MRPDNSARIILAAKRRSELTPRKPFRPSASSSAPEPWSPSRALQRAPGSPGRGSMGRPIFASRSNVSARALARPPRRSQCASERPTPRSSPGCRPRSASAASSPKRTVACVGSSRTHSASDESQLRGPALQSRRRRCSSMTIRPSPTMSDPSCQPRRQRCPQRNSAGWSGCQAESSR